jgi:choline dehydrogenase-like flavoprotein
MKRVVVVGSGPAGVQFTLSLLEKGYAVTLIDVGYRRPPHVRPDDTLGQLKANLEDPVEYFLGRELETITYPGAAGEYYAIPPGREYVFRQPPGFAYRTDGFSPLFSFAQGGLAEAWTGGVYPFNDAELADFPFNWADIAPDFSEVARRIGVSGATDDLARFMPPFDNMLPPLQLDRHSQKLLARYEKVKSALNRDGCFLGYSRIATLSRDREGRGACRYLGRCLWGCPVGAIWTPSMAVADCQRFPGFTYVSGVYVTHFSFDRQHRIDGVHGRRLDGGAFDSPVDTLVLAAGALNSSRIFLESIYRATGEVLRLPGLMDNQQVLLPFINFDMLGVPYEAASYQYHLLGFGLEAAEPHAYVHGQLTTLKTTMAHPIIKSLPFDLRASTAAFRLVRSALGLANINFHDERREDCALTLDPGGRDGEPMLLIQYRPAPAEAEHVRQSVQRVRKALMKLHCFAPPSMMHVRPKGASVHYTGTLPMMEQGGTLTTTPECRSRDFDNLFVADGATFPFLPAKNLTFALMANAVRIARTAF